MISLYAEGTDKLATWTTENTGGKLAIVADGNPNIFGPIPNGSLQLTGFYFLDQLIDIRNALLLSY